MEPTAAAVGWTDPEDAETVARVMQGLTHALERMVARNEREAVARGGEEAEAVVLPSEAERQRQRQRLGLAAFRGTRPPGISVGKYVERLQRFTGCSASCFVVGFVYIDRAAHRHPASPVDSRNVHRLLLTSLLLASKVLDDAHHNNAFFAKVGGVSIQEMKRLELELLSLLDFELWVSLRVYESYCWHLEREHMMARSQNKLHSDVLKDSDKISNGSVKPGQLNGSIQGLTPSSPRYSIDW